MKARPSRSKKSEIGPCRNRNERGVAACPPASCPVSIWFPPMTIPDLARIEGGDGGARPPALMPEPESFEEVHRFPIQVRLAQAERRDRPRVEPGPGPKRGGAAARPGLRPPCGL